jgi:hypothetical protein
MKQPKKFGLLDPEDKVTAILQNIGKYLPEDNT